jgi:phage terminase large subunit
VAKKFRPEVVSGAVNVTFPVAYTCRSYQFEFWRAMEQGCKRAALVWHRRAGKDLTALNWTIWAAFNRPGAYNYFFPTFRLGKRIMWDGQQADGRPFLDSFPKEWILDKNETEMKIVLRCKNGGHSIFQIIGADEADATSVGTNPVGCVFSEYSLMDNKAWNLTRPILAENGGWAIFTYTPRGKNHGYDLLRRGKVEADWFVSVKPCDQTRRDAQGEEGGPVMTPAAIDAERRLGMAEELIQQEFYCSFEGALLGSYYADQMKLAYEQERIRKVAWNPMYKVDTAWDLGLDDATCIWFTQSIDNKCYFIDYIESSSHGLDWYLELMWKKPYSYGRHFAPHDIAVRDYSTGKARKQFAAEKGFIFEPVPKLSLEEGINAGRMLFPVSMFDNTENDRLTATENEGKSVLYEGCSRGLSALASYRRDFDEKLMTWRNTHVHDWASNGADAYRTRAIAWQGDSGRPVQNWARTVYSMHGPIEQTHADQKPKYQGRVFGLTAKEQESALVDVDHGLDWWRDDRAAW